MFNLDKTCENNNLKCNDSNLILLTNTKFPEGSHILMSLTVTDNKPV